MSESTVLPDGYIPRAPERTVLYRAIAGAVTFVQRFGDALNLNVHFHVLALDGVFDADQPEAMRFVPLDPPTDTEVLRIARAFARRLARLLERRGLGAESDPNDTDPGAGRRMRLGGVSGSGGGLTKGPPLGPGTESAAVE